MSRDLTPHQLEILRVYRDVGSIRAAADALGISAQTIKNQLVLVYGRLQVRNLAQAMEALEKQ
jgi:DNA-binding NarL/FixJ family response regulator